MNANKATSAHVPAAILGAGLTGMSAALELRKLGVEHRIFERLAHPGGHAITLTESGYRFDRTGHLLHLRDPEIRERVLGWLGEDWVEVQRRSVVWSHGVYTRYPYQANTFGLPSRVAYECLMGFIDAQMRRERRGDAPPPENFEEFCLEHFGEGISRHFMIPYNSRLWGVHPREITAAWCQRFVPLPKLEDVVAGAVGVNDRELGYNTSFVYPKMGIGELPSAMARELGTIEFERAPTRVDFDKRELVFDDGVITYDALISTAPLDRLGKLLVGLPDDVRGAFDKLRCNDLYYLDVATKVPAGQPYHWIYVPEEKYPFYRLGCYSHFSPSMAPEGGASFYVELADRNQPDLDTLLPEVARAMTEMGIISEPDDILFARVRCIDHAYVVFDHAYFPSIETIFPFLERVDIVSAGRYGGWNYSSMEDALIFGRDAARAACRTLSESSH